MKRTYKYNGDIMSGYFDDESSMYKRFTSFEEDSEDAEFLKSLYPPELMKLQLLV